GCTDVLICAGIIRIFTHVEWLRVRLTIDRQLHGVRSRRHQDGEPSNTWRDSRAVAIHFKFRVVSRLRAKSRDFARVVAKIPIHAIDSGSACAAETSNRLSASVEYLESDSSS